MRISWHGYAALDADPAVYCWDKRLAVDAGRVAALLMRLFSVPNTRSGGTSYLLHRLRFTPAARRAANRTCMSSFKTPALWVEQWAQPAGHIYINYVRILCFKSINV